MSEAGGDDNRGLLQAVVGDGVPPLLVGAGSLVLAGGFAVFLALTGEFLPHDIRYLGMSAADLCSVAECRVVEFMVHDRAAFGGALIAVGILYTYLVVFPLRRGQAWAWWLLVCSVAAGFGSFLAYLGYGYLDTLHGLGTLLLIPVEVVGAVGDVLRPEAGTAPHAVLQNLVPDVPAAGEGVSRVGADSGCIDSIGVGHGQIVSALPPAPPTANRPHVPLML